LMVAVATGGILVFVASSPIANQALQVAVDGIRLN
jgi:hypothetical protein